MEPIYKWIAGPRREQVREFLEHYWENPESQADFVCAWLDEKGIIGLLEEIARE